MARAGSDVDWSFAPQPHLPPKSPALSGPGLGIVDNGNNRSSSSYFTSSRGSSTSNRSRPRHHRTPSTSFLPDAPEWIDDLLNDSPAAVAPFKGVHRRSSSDSVAFLETLSQSGKIHDIAEEEEWRKVGFKSGDRDGEDHLMLMFAELGLLDGPDIAHVDLDSFRTYSADNHKNKFNRYQKADSKAFNATQVSPGKGEPLQSMNWATDPTIDPKQAKRHSAQRSRVRKLQYISELEMTVNLLQEEVLALSSQVACVDHHRIILTVDNGTLKQRLNALAQEKLFSNAQNEFLTKEVQRLNLLWQQRQHKLTQKSTNSQQLLKTPVSPEQNDNRENLHVDVGKVDADEPEITPELSFPSLQPVESRTAAEDVKALTTSIP